jgi:hypothetical protein
MASSQRFVVPSAPQNHRRELTPEEVRRELLRAMLYGRRAATWTRMVVCGPAAYGSEKSGRQNE